jgi:HPt (histidine-containing phosphotransfer) domain-containing protein
MEANQPMSNHTSKIDLSYLYMLSSGNKDFEQKLLVRTVAEVNTLMDNLKNAWELKNGADVRKNAHSLVSLSAIAGIPGAVTSCREIDRAFMDDAFHPEFDETVKDIIACWLVSVPQLNDVIKTFDTYGSKGNASLQ